MSGTSIVKSFVPQNTVRVQQLSGMFDLNIEHKIKRQWNLDVVKLPKKWSIGLIKGPSGSGKTISARHLFGKYIINRYKYDNQSIVDNFPDDLPIETIIKTLSSVGFSSPPHWLMPYDKLSNGEKFRCDIARALCQNKKITVLDEFTSFVDRNVAKIVCVATAKFIRRNNAKFVAITCHDDVEEYLCPDWVYVPGLNKFYNGRYLHRPKIKIRLEAISSQSWELFKNYHYLSASCSKSAECYGAFINDTIVAFSAWINFVYGRGYVRREHRTVVLPDYQGLGIGCILSDHIAAKYRHMNFRAISTTSNPAMIVYRNKSKKWILRRCNYRNRGTVTATNRTGASTAYNRRTYSCEFVG